MKKLFLGLVVLATGLLTVSAQNRQISFDVSTRLITQDDLLFRAGDGSAAAPAYRFGLEPDTGLYRPGANAIGFSTAGTGRWILTAAGHWVPVADNAYDLGDGTTDPRNINFVGNLVNGAVSLTPTEFSYLDGGTSAFQTQIDGKQALHANLTALAGLADPNADRLFFWDDSAGTFAFLTVGSGLNISDTTITASGTAITIQEVDAGPSGTPGTLIFPNGSLTDNGDGTFTFTPSGSGDVTGPASATDTAIPRFSGTGGKTLQNSEVTIDASNNISTPGGISTGEGGSEAGYLGLGEGTAPALEANEIRHYAPTDVAAAGIAFLWPGTAASGFVQWANSSGVMTGTITATIPVSGGGTGLSSGTSGGVLYYSASGTLASSAALAANAIVIGGGAGAAPSTTTTAAGILTFLGTPSSANLATALSDEQGGLGGFVRVDPTAKAPGKAVKVAANGVDLEYADDEEGAGGADADAIHDNVAGEIVLVTEKTAVVGNDEVLIEDSEDSNNKKSVKVTNLPVSAAATTALNLKANLSGGNTLGGAQTLAEGASITLDAASSTATTFTGTTRAGTAGATLAFGDLIYLDPTDSRWELADANAASGADGDARGILGICVLAAAADGDPTVVLLDGIVRADAVFPAMTVNAPMYVSETAGDITGTFPTTADNVIRVVGTATTADEIHFKPGRVLEYTP